MTTTGYIREVTVDGKDIEVVTTFVFLGTLITEYGLCEKEVRRGIAMGMAAMGGLTSIWKDRGVTLETKVKLAKVLVFPIVLYGADTWTMRKHERRKIDACDARENEWSKKERKTETGMAGHTQGVCERSHHQQHETRRQGSGMERSCHGCRQGSDATRWHKVTRWWLNCFLCLTSRLTGMPSRPG